MIISFYTYKQNTSSGGYKDFTVLGYSEENSLHINQDIENDIVLSKKAEAETCVYLPLSANVNLFENWKKLKYIPDGYNIGEVEKLSFDNCYSLKKLDFNLINCSVVKFSTETYYTLFRNCFNLEEVIFAKNMFKCETSGKYMFSHTDSLKELDFTDSGFKPISIEGFLEYSGVETVKGLDTSSCVDFTSAFKNSNVKQLCKLSLASITTPLNYFTYMFNESLNIFGGFVDTEQVTEWKRSSMNPFFYATNLEIIEEMGIIKGKDFNVSKCKKLTIDSLMVIINALYDYVGNNDATEQTCTIGEVNLAKLTEEQIAVATSKGWVLE